MLYFGKSAVNPLIYGWKNNELREALIRSVTREGSRSEAVVRKGSNVIHFIAEQQEVLRRHSVYSTTRD